MTTLPPAVKWAERDDRLYITVEAPGAKAEEVNVVVEDSGKFEFKYKQYAVSCELLKEIVKADSKWAFTGRGVVFDIVKKEKGYWNKLFKVPAGKPSWLGVDWARWKDEDDDDEDEADPTAGMGGMDFSSLMGGANGMNFGDMGDMGAEMGDDEDDDDMPDLEGDVPEEEKTEEKKEEEEEKKKEEPAAN